MYGDTLLGVDEIPPYSASAAEGRIIFMILQKTYIGPLRGRSLFVGILEGCDER